jgi:mono/diheme cytochrome c family protein
MFKAFLVLLVVSAAGAQEIKRASIQPTLPGDGKAMFTQYCAACHGNDGRGGGPAATALKKRPADLTQLARKNNGNFPELQVQNYIVGDSDVAAHGSRDMPMWGELFHSLNQGNRGETQIRVSVLTAYIESLQAR